MEHLIDPWQCLKRLKEYLKPGGSVIASIPNVNPWRVLKDFILYDKWEYVTAGTLDRTHLRFFTNKSIKAMFEECGYRIVHRARVSTLRIWVKALNIASLGMLKRFLTYQFLVVARKSL